MSYTFVNRPAVEDDIKAAVAFYKTISPALAREFINRLREAREYISKFPLGFEVKYNNVRTLLLKQFPYHIHYLVDDETKQIVILAVIHSYKNPEDYTAR